MEVDVPISVAYKCYSDREAIPRWMPFISSVKVCQNPIATPFNVCNFNIRPSSPLFLVYKEKLSSYWSKQFRMPSLFMLNSIGVHYKFQTMA